MPERAIVLAGEVDETPKQFRPQRVNPALASPRTLHVVGKAWWLSTPRADERVTLKLWGDPVTKPRWEWLRAAARALLSSTTPGGRYLIVNDGFVAFATRSLVIFRELSPLRLDTLDLRVIWEYLAHYVRRYEGHMQAGLAKLHEKERRRFSSDIPRVQDEQPAIDTEPVVEAIRDGALKRVR